MRQILSLVLAFTFLGSLAFSAGVTSAAPAASSRLTAVAAQEVGDTVVINDIDGNEVGTATVEDIVDPFEDMEQTPERGLRFISVELTIENTGEDVLTVSPGNIGVVDDAGIIYVTVTDVDRTDNLDPLEDVDLEPGDDVTGALAVGFPEDGEIAQIIWLVGEGQLPVLINNLDPVEAGDPVTLFTVDYEEEAEVTVEEVVDEFEDAESDAGRGGKYVGVTVTFENVSEEPISPDPASVFLGTVDGIFWAPVFDIERTADSIDDVPDLITDPIEPGDSVTGFVGFNITDGLDIAYVMYLPDTTRLIRIFDADTGRGDDDETPEADDDDNNGGLGPIGRRTPTAEADDDDGRTPRADGDECAGAAEWQEITIETLGAWGGVFRELDLQNPGPETLTQIEDGIETIRDAADEQADSNPPPAAEELNELIVQAYEDSSDALELLLEAVDTNDPDLFDEALTTIGDIGSSFTDGEVADVLAEAQDACPELDEL